MDSIQGCLCGVGRGVGRASLHGREQGRSCSWQSPLVDCDRSSQYVEAGTKAWHVPAYLCASCIPVLRLRLVGLSFDTTNCIEYTTWVPT
jgi:hypothetical protein